MDPNKPSDTSELAPDDPDAPASAEELAEATRLRDALEDPRIENDAAALARAMAVAHAAREINPAENRVIVERAIARVDAAGARRGASRARGGGTLIRVAFGVAATLSVAAAFALYVRATSPTLESASASAWTTPLAPARSTQPLFNEPFAGSSSARIDRIARARAGDLRDNRFAMRGVR